MALLDVTSNGGRNGPEVDAARVLLQFFEGRPGQECRVDIDVKYVLVIVWNDDLIHNNMILKNTGSLQVSCLKISFILRL